MRGCNQVNLTIFLSSYIIILAQNYYKYKEVILQIDSKKTYNESNGKAELMFQLKKKRNYSIFLYMLESSEQLNFLRK